MEKSKNNAVQIELKLTGEGHNSTSIAIVPEEVASAFFQRLHSWTQEWYANTDSHFHFQKSK